MLRLILTFNCGLRYIIFHLLIVLFTGAFIFNFGELTVCTFACTILQKGKKKGKKENIKKRFGGI